MEHQLIPIGKNDREGKYALKTSSDTKGTGKLRKLWQKLANK